MIFVENSNSIGKVQGERQMAFSFRKSWKNYNQFFSMLNL